MPEERHPFQEIESDLRDKITRGELSAGDRIPTVRALSEQWGVARATVDRALQRLRTDGLIESASGRGGSRVTAQGSKAELLVAIDSDEVITIEGAQITTADRNAADVLGVKLGSPLLKLQVRVSRSS